MANIGDRLTTLSPFSDVYIFPLPFPLNCSGTVSALQYCYIGSNLGTQQSVFTLLFLQQSGSNFTVTKRLPVSSTPTNMICTNRDFGGFIAMVTLIIAVTC